MSWTQKTFTLPSKSRGSYLITSEVESALPEISSYKVGLLNLFLQHTSCALSLNENWDEDVRADMSDALDRIAPEDKKGGLYRHAAEGRDDMPVSLDACICVLGALGLIDLAIGSYQVCSDWGECDGAYQQWETGDWYVAGHLVSGI